MNFENTFFEFEKKMRTEKVPDIAIQNFKYYYTQLVEGNTGLIHASEVNPIKSLPNSETLPEKCTLVGKSVLPQVANIRLNGGLGTSMGLENAKSLIKVKNGLSFLDIVALQVLQLDIPLVLMNSFITRDDSISLLREKYPSLGHHKFPLDFLQHKTPKIRKSDLSPVTWKKNPELEWCPPGHGDIYSALVTSGMLDQLTESGIKYILISNADNLGSAIDPTILGYMIESNAPVLMEVADRSEMDKKGGFPVYRHDGSPLLWETAQCPPEDMEIYQDVQYFKYFNANNIWVDLSELKKEMKKNNNNLRLPMIRNEKMVDVKDKNSTPVYQLETAVGSIVSVNKDARLIKVPNDRFCPVKMTNELLAVRSDAYVLTKNYRLILNPERSFSTPIINLDPRYYKFLDDFEARFPEEIPSLKNCKTLSVEGDFKFGKNVIIKGDSRLVNSTNTQVVLDNLTIEGELTT